MRRPLVHRGLQRRWRWYLQRVCTRPRRHQSSMARLQRSPAPLGVRGPASTGICRTVPIHERRQPPYRRLPVDRRRQTHGPRSRSISKTRLLAVQEGPPMTTTMQPQITVTEHNVAEHAHNLLIMSSAVRETQRAIYELRAAITAYMQAENSTVWTDGKVSATLKPGAPS